MGGLASKWNFWEQPDFEWPTEDAKKEGLEFLNDYKIDFFDEWAERNSWTVEEAMVLSFGLDPEKTIIPEGLISPPEVSVIRDRMGALLERILDAQSSGLLPPKICPSVYLDWAEHNGVDVPETLQEIMSQHKVAPTYFAAIWFPDNFRRWVASPYWTADEAVALSQAGLPQDFWEKVQFSGNWGVYARLRDRFRKAFPNPERPSVWLAWIKQNGIRFREEIDKAVARHEQDIIDLQPRYDDLKERSEEQKRDITALRYEVEKRNVEIHKLRLELKKASAMVHPEPVVKDLHPKERITAYTLIYGLARLHFTKQPYKSKVQYDPRVETSRPIKQIVAELEDYELPTTDDTVRKWLVDAEGYLDAKALETKRLERIEAEKTRLSRGSKQP